MRDDVVELQIPSQPEFLSIVRNTVAAVAERMHFGSDDIADLKLAVGEACSNAVRHGCCLDGPCEVRVRCRVTGRSISVEVYNHVFDGTVPPTICKIPDLSREGGLGLYMIRKLMDDVSLVWDDGWAMVKMVKKRKTSRKQGITRPRPSSF